VQLETEERPASGSDEFVAAGTHFFFGYSDRMSEFGWIDFGVLRDEDPISVALAQVLK
jgi:hypothetical protein